jgi:hypothetical protein
MKVEQLGTILIGKKLDSTVIVKVIDPVGQQSFDLDIETVRRIVDADNGVEHIEIAVKLPVAIPERRQKQ